jgi:hypothetical protein
VARVDEGVDDDLEFSEVVANTRLRLVVVEVDGLVFDEPKVIFANGQPGLEELLFSLLFNEYEDAESFGKVVTVVGVVGAEAGGVYGILEYFYYY